MECGKQGLSSFVTNVYSVKDGYENDFSKIPRPTHNLCILYKGTARIIEGASEITINKNEMFFIPKGSKYISFWNGEGDIVFQTLHFEFDRQFDPLKGLKMPIQKIKVDDIDYIKAQFTRLLTLQRENSFEFNTCFYSVCENTISKLIYTKNTQVSVVQPALEYLDKSYNKKVTVKELAALCCISEPRFFAVFKRDVGISPIEYKNRLCIHKAMDELVTMPNKSIESIAVEYGFDSSVYFRRLFKVYTGKTPKEYRLTSGII